MFEKMQIKNKWEIFLTYLLSYSWSSWPLCQVYFCVYEIQMVPDLTTLYINNDRIFLFMDKLHELLVLIWLKEYLPQRRNQ